MKSALDRAVREVDPDLPIFGVRTMDEVKSRSLARRRFSVCLMSAFAIAAVLLAALGIYGVMAFLVGQRSQEFGLRLALGVTPSNIMQLAFRPGTVLAAQGAIIGVLLALPATGFSRPCCSASPPATRSPSSPCR